jgi:hypothetical protein
MTDFLRKEHRGRLVLGEVAAMRRHFAPADGAMYALAEELDIPVALHSIPAARRTLSALRHD